MEKRYVITRSSNSISHAGTGKERKNHKYISREWKNGKWKYYYDELKENVKNITGIGLKDDMAKYQKQAEAYRQQKQTAQEMEIRNLNAARKALEEGNTAKNKAETLSKIGYKPSDIGYEQGILDKKVKEFQQDYENKYGKNVLYTTRETKEDANRRNELYNEQDKLDKKREWAERDKAAYDEAVSDIENAQYKRSYSFGLAMHWVDKIFEAEENEIKAQGKYDKIKETYEKSLAGKIDKAKNWIDDLFNNSKSNSASKNSESVPYKGPTNIQQQRQEMQSRDWEQRRLENAYRGPESAKQAKKTYDEKRGREQALLALQEEAKRLSEKNTKERVSTNLKDADALHRNLETEREKLRKKLDANGWSDKKMENDYYKLHRAVMKIEDDANSIRKEIEEKENRYNNLSMEHDKLWKKVASRPAGHIETDEERKIKKDARYLNDIINQLEIDIKKLKGEELDEYEKLYEKMRGTSRKQDENFVNYKVIRR